MSGSRRPSPPKQRTSHPEADPFDRWVDRQLHRLYDDVASEGMPPRLRELIENADRHDRGESRGGDGGEAEPRDSDGVSVDDAVVGGAGIDEAGIDEAGIDDGGRADGDAGDGDAGEGDAGGGSSGGGRR